MTDKTIDQLTITTVAISGTDELPIWQSSATWKTTFADVAAYIGGASAGWSLDPVTTGTTHSVTLSSARVCTYWTSGTGGAKTTTVPGAAGGNAGYEVALKTTLGNGDTHNVIPASGTIDGVGTYTFSDFKSAISFISDGSSNWMIV